MAATKKMDQRPDLRGKNWLKEEVIDMATYSLKRNIAERKWSRWTSACMGSVKVEDVLALRESLRNFVVAPVDRHPGEGVIL